MRWAIINPWTISSKSIGGTERYVKDLAYALKTKRCEVDVYMLSGDSYVDKGINFISLNICDEIDEYKLKAIFGDMLSEATYDKVAQFLESKIDAAKYDVFQLNSHLFLKCWQNKNRIFTIHSNRAEFCVTSSLKEFEFQVEMMKRQASLGMKFVVPSKSYFQHWKRVLKRNVFSIPHAIDVSRLKCSIPKREIEKTYGLDSRKIKFILPSRLEPVQKRPKYFLKACAGLDDVKKSKIQTILTGIDVQYEKYATELKVFAIAKKLDVKFVKFEDINEGFKVGDCIVVPSKSETFGYSALEGLSLGKVTILSKIPTFEEISQQNDQAHLFSNLKELTNILIELIDENRFEEKKPSKKWQEGYDINLWIEKYINLSKQTF